MKNFIHPAIDKLNLPKKTKLYFSRLEFYEIIEDPIALSSKENPIDERVVNKWSFAVDRKLRFFNKQNLEPFYMAVINARSEYLIMKHPMKQMIFYTWYESISGNFYFSLISIEYKELLFGDYINRVDSLGVIIQEFIDDPYKGIIPMSEFTLVYPEDPAWLQEDDETNKRTVNIWYTIIPD